jgi:ADP-ribosyl-[dinitrogen reductase] hydrolase
MEWFHLPIQDMAAPDESFDDIWTEMAPRIPQMIKQGDNVLVHCRGGLGRSGTIAALLLIEFGLPNGLAIAQVRIARPGAIDIAEQEEYVRRYVALGQPS